MSYFLGKNLKIYSKRIALAILLAVLFVPSLALAQSPTPTPSPTPTSTTGTCDLTKITNSNVKADYAFEPSRNTAIHPTQVFQLGIKITDFTDPAMLEACVASNNLKISTELNLYVCGLAGFCRATVVAWSSATLSDTAKQITDSSGKVIGFGGLFEPTSASAVLRAANGGEPVPVPDTAINTLYLYFSNKISVGDSTTNFTYIPTGDAFALNREIRFDAAVGPPGAVSPDFAPSVQGNVEANQNSLTSSLFDFLRQVIAYVVLLITSFIYYIFSVILVPVIVALIKVRPYQDGFVNFIYPGWIILRNVSNILFIVALLWIGLRTIFQLEDAAKSRTFILRLILAALLVNFSLVIGQAVVGIADTLQSQFLPGNTKVIETLGFKLMVDPIQTFRGVEGANPDDFKLTDEQKNYTPTGLASDLPKAIILLILAVAAFFAFVALIAFLVVRLVALWLLYMISPLAYVASILPKTQEYTGKWWNEFIKYSFAVPIMAFFLNIAALLAVNMSAATGQTVDTGGTTKFVLGGLIPVSNLGEGVVSFATTVLSHFLVLVFMFAGMQFALKFGGYGSQKIVDAAQTGFKKAFEYPWRGAKGLGRYARDSAAAGALESKYVKDRPKLANTISAVAQPTATAKALRDKLFTQPKKKQLETIAKGRGDLEEFAGNVGANKKMAMKMLGYKLTGNTAAAMRARQAIFGEMLTDNERTDIRDKIADQQEDLRDINAGLIVPDNKFITKKQAELFRNNIDKDLERIDKEEVEAIAPLEEQRSKALAKGQTGKAAELEKKITDIQEKSEADRVDRRKVQKHVEDELAKLPPDAEDGTVFSLGSSGTAKGVLTLIAKDVKADIDELEGQLKSDDALRSKNQISKWDEDDRAKVEAGMSKVISQREWPETVEGRAARMAKENEEIKKLDGIDDPEAQIAAFKTAISKNNTALASAIAKQMSKSGNFDKLLTAEGYKNNLDDFKKFMAEKFKGSPVVVRNQVASELSSLNLQNGNRAVGHATTVNSEGVINWNTKERQETLLAKSASKKKVWEKKSGELFRETNTGQKEFLRGEEEEIHKMAKNPDQLKRVSERMSSKTASDLLDLHEQKMAGKNVMSKAFDKNVVDALKKAAGTA